MSADGAKRRITAAMLLCLGLGVLVATRAAFLQLGPNPRLEQMAKRQFQSKVLVRPRRGPILDRNGEPLVANREISSLAANPSKIRNRRTLARLLSKATDLPYSKLFQRLGGGREKEKKEQAHFVWIKRHLGENDLGRLKRWGIIDAAGDIADGLLLVKESKRVFPHNELASHVLGDVNIDSEGLEGVELWMNERLKGKVVSVAAIKDALGRPAFIDTVAARNVQEGRDGEPVTLTIDASLQFVVEEELRNSVRKSNARGGSVIVMNAVTGEILAMANQPAYNPNEKGASPDQKRNRAITDGFEPGSTMKAILLAGGLAHGMKLSDTVFGENGQMIVQGKRISEAEAHEKFKWISLKKMIQVSSNVGAAKLALKLGADRYYATLQSFGFGAKTNTGFPGEISGKVPPRKSWQPLSLANIGFGHGLLVTPIQMVRAYAAFLNGGWLVQPSLIKAPQGSVSPGAQAAGPVPEKPRRILPEKVARQVVEALESVTQEGGTGLKAVLPGYRVAGKTGTAQKVDPATGGYSRAKYVASFIGFPLEVEPRIVIFASIDEPHGLYYASETAAPLFREVLSAVANRFSLPARNAPPRVLAGADSIGKEKPLAAPVVMPAEMQVEDSDSLSVVQAAPEPAAAGIDKPPADEDAGELHWQGSGPNGRFLWKMPSLLGLAPREAIQVLQGHHFQVEIQGVGVVRSQSPDEGKVVADGDTIRLVLNEP
ncbi:MAG: transpeptidase family protein [Oligoflexia bacterium]|nr:transpeptidase family protein [Oligoflexia bacterium]